MALHNFIIVDGGLSDVNTPIQTSKIVTLRTIEISEPTKSVTQQTKIARRFNDALAAVFLLGTCGFCFWYLMSSMH